AGGRPPERHPPPGIPAKRTADPRGGHSPRGNGANLPVFRFCSWYVLDYSTPNQSQVRQLGRCRHAALQLVPGAQVCKKQSGARFSLVLAGIGGLGAPKSENLGSGDGFAAKTGTLRSAA